MQVMRLSWIGALAILLFSCSSAPQDPVAQAATEATAIIKQAQATAMVISAQATATALMQQALGGPGLVATARPELEAANTPVAILITPMPDILPEISPTAAQTAASKKVELLGVGYAAEGGFIMILYTAPPVVANQWYQGNVYVIDESNNATYDQIPVMPVIGPLIAQPVEEGQRGYVMLMNHSPGLQPGTLVTVNLGEYKFEHVEFGK